MGKKRLREKKMGDRGRGEVLECFKNDLVMFQDLETSKIANKLKDFD